MDNQDTSNIGYKTQNKDKQTKKMSNTDHHQNPVGEARCL